MEEVGFAGNVAVLYSVNSMAERGSFVITVSRGICMRSFDPLPISRGRSDDSTGGGSVAGAHEHVMGSGCKVHSNKLPFAMRRYDD